MNRSQTWQQVWLVLALLVAGTALIAASGADLAAPYFIYRRRKPRVAQRWLVGGMTFGLLMGYARLVPRGAIS